MFAFSSILLPGISGKLRLCRQNNEKAIYRLEKIGAFICVGVLLNSSPGRGEKDSIDQLSVNMYLLQVYCV